MIDASKGFIKDGNKNRLRAQDIHKIVDVFTRQIELPRYSRMVPVAEIASPANDYNLNIPRYIDSSEPEDLHDLEAHLNGGIPNRDIDALGAYWEVFPPLREALFQANGRAGYSEPRVDARGEGAILGHAEFTGLPAARRGVFEEWRDDARARAQGSRSTICPSEVIRTLSEDLLARFADLPLLEPVRRLPAPDGLLGRDDAGRRLPHRRRRLDGGGEAARDRRGEGEKDQGDAGPHHRKKKYKMDLVPPALIVARYFAEGAGGDRGAAGAARRAARELEEFIEEHGGEEGLLDEAMNDKGKVTKGGVKDAAQGDRRRSRKRRGARGAETLPGVDGRRDRAGQGGQGGAGHARRKGAAGTPTSPRPRSRRWSSRTNGSRPSGPPSKAKCSADPTLAAA